MATLAFEVQADYDKVIRLREEITRLQTALDNMQGNGSKEAIAQLEGQLTACREEMKQTVTAAANLGSSIEQSVQKMSFSTVEEQMNALQYAIHQNEQALADGIQQLEQWKGEAEAAFNAGNMGTVEAITADIKEQALRLQELQQQAEGYKAALQGLTDGGVDTSISGVTSSLSRLDAACDENRAEIERLTAEYEKLNAQYEKGVVAGSKEEQAILSRMQTIRGEITVRKSLNKEMQEQATILQQHATAMQQSTEATDTTTAAHESLRTKIKQLKQEMAEMRMQGIDEQSAAYKRLVDELGRLQDIQGDISRQGSIMANDERAIAGIQSGVQGLTGAFMGANAAIGLFSRSNQELQQVLVKSHYLMAITNGLQQAAAMLNKDSAFRLVALTKAREWWNNLLAVGRGEEVADTAAQVANTAATTTNTAATTGNTTATTTNTAGRIAQTTATTAGTTATITFTGAMRMAATAMKDMVKAIPVWGWVLAAVGAVTASITALVKKVKESNKTIQTAALTAEEAAKKIAEDIYKPIGSLQLLREQWQRLGDDMQAKEKFIKDNADTFRALKLSIDTVADAERVLIDNTDAYVNAMVSRAKANILATQVEDDVKTIAELEQRLEGISKTRRTIATFWSQDEVNDEYTSVERELAQRKQLLQNLVKDAADADEAAKKAETAAGMTTTTPSSSTTATTTAQDYGKDTAKYKDLVAKQGKEEARAVIEMQYAIRQAEIDAMKDGNAKTLAQIELDFQEQETAIEQWYEDLKDKKIQKAKELWEANPDTKGQPFDAGAIDVAYSEEENTLYDAQIQANEDKRKKSIEEIYKVETAALRDFLKEYGTYEEQRAAIAAEYAEKIAEAQTQGEKMSLTAQRDRDLQKLAFEYEDTTNWEAIFTNIDKYTVDYLKTIQEKLKDLLAGDDITAEQAEALGKQLNKVNQLLLEKDKSWSDILGFTTERQRELNRLYQDQLDAQDRLNEAQERYNNSLAETQAIQGDIEQILQGLGVSDVDVSAGNALGISSAAQEAGADSDTLRDIQGLTTKLAASEAATNSLGKEVKKNTDSLTAATEAYKGASKRTKEERTDYAIEVAEKVSQGLRDVGSLTDALGFDESVGRTFDDLSNGVNSSIDAFKSFASGDYVGAAVSAIGAVKSFGNVLSGLFGFGETDKSLHDDMEALTYSNQALENSINELTNTMNKTTTSLTEATEDYETAKKNLEKMEEDTASIMQRAGIAHNNGLFTSDHSSNYYIKKNMTEEDWAAVSAAAGVTVGSASDFWRLTSEQMYNVSVQAAAQYAKIKQYADDGHDDVAQYMDEYIGYWQELQDLEDEYNKKLTDTDFDSVVSNFQSAISDMNHSAADFADDFENMMKDAVISSLISSTYASRLEQWYNDFADAMGNDSTLDKSEQETLKKSYMDIVEEAQRDIEALYDTLGWSKEGYSQSGTTGGFTTMTEDTAEELNGRFTALQEAGYQILAQDQVQTSLLSDLETMRDYSLLLTDISRENRSILADSYLELQSINDNTADTVAQLIVMAKYLKNVKENTDRL